MPVASAEDSRAVVLDSRAVHNLMSIIRDKETHHREFSFYSDRLFAILAEEALARLPGVEDAAITTPCGTYPGLRGVPADDIAVVSVVRAGDGLARAVRQARPGMALGKILIQRDEASEDKRPVLMYSKLPDCIASKR